jgi:uncharacterized protein (DUF302 family)
MAVPELTDPETGRCVVCEIMATFFMEADSELSFAETYQRISNKLHGAGNATS